MTGSYGSIRFLSRRVSRLIVAIVVIGFLFFVVTTSFGGFWPFLHGFTWRSAVDVVEAEFKAAKVENPLALLRSKSLA